MQLVTLLTLTELYMRNDQYFLLDSHHRWCCSHRAPTLVGSGHSLPSYIHSCILARLPDLSIGQRAVSSPQHLHDSTDYVVFQCLL